MLVSELLDNPLTLEEWESLSSDIRILERDVIRGIAGIVVRGRELRGALDQVSATGDARLLALREAATGILRAVEIGGSDAEQAFLVFRRDLQRFEPHFPENPFRTNPAFDLVDRACTPGNVSIVVGGRGTGKSATGFWMLEQAHERSLGRPLFAVGLPPESRKLFPKYIVTAKEMNDVPNDSIVLLEESALLFKARKSFSEANLLLVDTIDIARHKQLSLIFITQSSALVDVNIMRLGDTLVIKEPSLLQVELERRQVKQVMVKAASALEAIPESQRKGKAYIIDVKYEGITNTGLPTFWSEELSRMYGSYAVGQQNPGSGTVDAISYFCGGDSEVGLCPKDQGSRYVHHFAKNKPKVLLNEEGKMWILGRVEVKESGINDYTGSDNDFGQYEPPGEVRKIGELVSLTVNGDELLIKDGVLATDQGGQRLFVLEKSEVKR